MSDGARRDAAIHAGAVAPFSLMSLHLEFKERLAVVAAKFPLLATKSATRAPSVLDGWLPPKPNAEAEQFPFLILRPSSGNDTWEGADQTADATLTIVVGTYSDTDDGWLDLLLLIDAIRSDLAEAPTIIGTAFEHYGPLSWTIPEQQPRPQWIGVVTTIWNISRPRRIEARNPDFDPQEG